MVVPSVAVIALVPSTAALLLMDIPSAALVGVSAAGRNRVGDMVRARCAGERARNAEAGEAERGRREGENVRVCDCAVR